MKSGRLMRLLVNIINLITSGYRLELVARRDYAVVAQRHCHELTSI